ncbi:MAG: DUF882 domain-containing protein [Alphaproteobacteria bacterium]|nr:DUF882 domain-containing protein [Alphaproteobacteria bacterium]
MTASAGLAAPVLISGKAEAAQTRSVSFESLHTGERLRTVYWADGDYVPGALSRVDWVLRDHRSNLSHPIDPRLLDLLDRLRRALDTHEPYQVISGYRSPATNSMLASASTGVARNSLHTRGVAIDIRVPGVSLARLRDAARSLAAGGVGYYARSDFVHVDIGRVRAW